MENTNESIENTEEVQETQENTIQETQDTINFADIHNDLGIICCFLIFFTLVIILKYSYKFFDMIFQF